MPGHYWGQHPGTLSHVPVFVAWLRVGYPLMRPAGARSSTGLWRPGDGVRGVLVVPGGRHAPLDWNSYCVHELAHNTLLFLFFFLTTNCCFSIKVCHVLLCMSRNTGQINPAGFQSLKYMYYTYVIMTIKWFFLLWLLILTWICI